MKKYLYIAGGAALVWFLFLRNKNMASGSTLSGGALLGQETNDLANGQTPLQ